MIRRHKLSIEEAWVPSAVPFFLLGFVYYLITPALVVRFLADDSDLIYTTKKYVDFGYYDATYFFDALVVLLSFLLGYSRARASKKPRISVLDYGCFQQTVPSLLVIIFAILFVLFCLQANASGIGFFTGYSTYNIFVLGPFSTCAFMSVWFANYFSNRQIRLLFLALFIACSVLLLGWGSRMYFVLGFLALMLGIVTRDRKLLKSLWFQCSILAIGLLMVVIGVLRFGGGEITSDSLIAVFFAEPLYVSLTGALYLDNAGGRPVFGVPGDLIAALINFIPSAVFPAKIDLMSKFTYSEFVWAPFGGRSLIANLYPNFGYFYPIYVALIGLYFGFLYRKAKSSAFYRATYFSALPILMLYFYREGLTTFVKLVFFNGLLLPVLVALFLTLAVRKKAISYSDSLA